jgi:hypothetical protein
VARAERLHSAKEALRILHGTGTTRELASQEDVMFIPKPAFLITAAALAAAISIPAVAQQPAQNEAPAATPSRNADHASDDRDRSGWRWRGRDRYSQDDEDEPGDRRSYRERRYGRDGDGEDGRWRGGPRERGMMEHRGMMGRPGMMGRQGMGQPFGMRMMCGPHGGRVGEAMLARLEGITQPTAEQRPAFDKLKDAIAKATETVRAACPTERPITPPGRLAAAEKRLSALLDAVRLVRPAMDEYYGSLSDEQKARLYISRVGRGPEGFRGWQGGRDGRSGDSEQYRDQNRSYGGQNRRDDRTQHDADDDDEMETEHL